MDLQCFIRTRNRNFNHCQQWSDDYRSNYSAKQVGSRHKFRREVRRYNPAQQIQKRIEN